MDDIFKSLKAYLYERAVSPLFGAIIISWLIWNFRVVLLLFSDLNVLTKLGLIETYFESVHPVLDYYNYYGFPFCNHGEGYIFNSIVAPLYIALIYIFLFPLISIPVYRFSLWTDSVMISLKKKMDGKKILTVEESTKVYEKLALAEDKYNDDIDTANKKIQALADKLKELEPESDLLKTSSSSGSDTVKFTGTVSNGKQNKDEVSKRLPEIQHSVMEAFQNGEQEMDYSSIKNLHESNNNHIVRHAIDDLVSTDYLSTSFNGDDIYITSKGRKYLIDHILPK